MLFAFGANVFRYIHLQCTFKANQHMGLIRKTEAMPSRNTLNVLFGPPGCGKTTLSMQVAGRPVVCIDADGGAGRAQLRSDVFQPTGYAEVWEWVNGPDFAAPTATTPAGEFYGGVVIIDTAKAFLDDLIGTYVTKTDKANEKKGGALSQQGYGAMKDTFTAFLRKLWAVGCDVVVVAHTKEVSKKKGEVLRETPDVTGGSLGVLMGKADLVGFCYMDGGQLYIDFNPADEHIGKNPIEMPVLSVPHYTRPEFRNYMGNLIETVRGKLVAISEEAARLNTAVAEGTAQFAAAATLSDLYFAAREVLHNAEPLAALALNKELSARMVELVNAEELAGPEDTGAVLSILTEIEGLPAPADKRTAYGAKKALNERATAAGLMFDKEARAFKWLPGRGPEAPAEPAGEAGGAEPNGEPQNRTEAAREAVAKTNATLAAEGSTATVTTAAQLPTEPKKNRA